MRCEEHAPSKVRGPNPRPSASIWATRQAVGAVAGRRGRHGVGRVVDPDDLPSGAQEPRRLESLAAPHVENAPLADPVEHGAVARPRAAPAGSPGSPPVGAARPSGGSWCWWPRVLQSRRHAGAALPAYTTRRPSRPLFMTTSPTVTAPRGRHAAAKPPAGGRGSR